MSETDATAADPSTDDPSTDLARRLIVASGALLSGAPSPLDTASLRADLVSHGAGAPAVPVQRARRRARALLGRVRAVVGRIRRRLR